MADGDADQSLRFVVAIGDLSEHVGGVLVAAVAGYRTQLLEAGFSTEAAELMAVDYHRSVVAAVLTPNVDSP